MVISKVYVHAPAGMDYHKNTKSEKKKKRILFWITAVIQRAMELNTVIPRSPVNHVSASTLHLSAEMFRRSVPAFWNCVAIDLISQSERWLFLDCNRQPTAWLGRIIAGQIAARSNQAHNILRVAAECKTSRNCTNFTKSPHTCTKLTTSPLPVTRAPVLFYAYRPSVFSKISQRDGTSLLRVIQ